MKLVDLLVERLEEWPEGVTYFVQDVDGEVKAAGESEPREPSEPTSSGIWIRYIALDNYNFYSSLCADWQTSVITKDIYTKHKEGMLLTQQTQMKQIIVNVGGLPIEEKQRVNEALAKIQNVPKIENVTTGMAWFYAPSSFGLQVGWNSILKRETPTHTPQQVLEMAGMSPAADQHVFLADTLIITDSTGSIIYDSTIDEKKKGHIHAESMAQYAEDALTNEKPWELWQFKVKDGDWAGVWCDCPRSPHWRVTTEYRRKPKTHNVNGVEVPDLRVSPEYGDYYYLANPSSRTLFTYHKFVKNSIDKIWFERGLVYQHSEEGKQAAILHSKAMLGVA